MLDADERVSEARCARIGWQPLAAEAGVGPHQTFREVRAQLPSRIRELLQWLVIDPLPFWAAVLGPLGALAAVWRMPGSPEFRVRAAGYVVTLLGVLLVANGILQTQALFGQPKLHMRVTAWLRRLPPIFNRRNTVYATASGSLGGFSASATGYVRASAQNQSLEARVVALEGNLRRIDDRITVTENLVRAEVRSMKETIAAERTTREKADRTLSERLESFSVGSLDYEIVGAIWVIIGQAFGSFPTEIAKVLS